MFARHLPRSTPFLPQGSRGTAVVAKRQPGPVVAREQHQGVLLDPSGLRASNTLPTLQSISSMTSPYMPPALRPTNSSDRASGMCGSECAM